MQEIAEHLWSERLDRYLRAVGKTAADISADAKGAAWKAAIAAAMKQSTTASNPWLAQRLNMGSMYRRSRLVSECRKYPAS